MKIRLEIRGDVIWASAYNDKISSDGCATYWEDSFEKALISISRRIKYGHPENTRLGAIVWI